MTHLISIYRSDALMQFVRVSVPICVMGKFHWNGYFTIVTDTSELLVNNSEISLIRPTYFLNELVISFCLREYDARVSKLLAYKYRKLPIEPFLTHSALDHIKMWSDAIVLDYVF